MTQPDLSDLPRLPQGWLVRAPEQSDIPRIHTLTEAQHALNRGSSLPDPAWIRSLVVGTGSWSRRQLVVEYAGEVEGWVAVHDRAAGRSTVELVVSEALRTLGDAAGVAAFLLAFVEREARDIARLRAIGATRLDASPDAADLVMRRWLARAGYTQTRSWEHMSRPVTHDESTPGEELETREGVRVRRVRLHPSGMPVAADIQTVHRMLEESFTDHWGTYRESFPEFLQRLREDTGHAWRMWWIAEILHEGRWVPGGAVVTSLLPPDEEGAYGTYLDYIGVHRRARGHGVAKSLLGAVIADAAAAGHDRVGLEVDADSPTGADGMYRSMGWKPVYVTESWHKDIDLPPVVT